MILVLFEVHISVIHPPEAKPFQLWANLVRTTTQNRGWSLATAMRARRTAYRTAVWSPDVGAGPIWCDDGAILGAYLDL